MSLFLFLLAYILLTSVLVYRTNIINCYRYKSKDNFFIFFTMGLLLLLNCLRSVGTGNDTYSYKALFDYYSNQYFVDYSQAALIWMDSYIDIGFRVLNKIFTYFCNNYQIFISIIACFIYFSTIKFIKKYSDNVVISVVLFFLAFFHAYINVLRQAIAISIVLLGFELLYEKKILKFILFVLLATTFHKTAIITLIFIPIVHMKKFSINKGILAILGCIILTYGGFVQLLISTVGYSGSYISEENGISVYASILLSVLIFFVMVFLKGKNNFDSLDEICNGDNLQSSFYIRIPIVHICISIMSLALPILYRFEYYFTIFYIVGLPYYIMNSKTYLSNKKILTFFLIIVFASYVGGILIFRPEWYSEFFYHFFWE